MTSCSPEALFHRQLEAFLLTSAKLRWVRILEYVGRYGTMRRNLKKRATRRWRVNIASIRAHQPKDLFVWSDVIKHQVVFTAK